MCSDDEKSNNNGIPEFSYRKVRFEPPPTTNA
jgi:hypothetical protein